jgi:hypothetical protein
MRGRRTDALAERCIVRFEAALRGWQGAGQLAGGGPEEGAGEGHRSGWERTKMRMTRFLRIRGKGARNGLGLTARARYLLSTQVVGQSGFWLLSESHTAVPPSKD